MLVLNKRAEISITLIENTEVLDFLLVTLLQSKCDSLTHYSIWENCIRASGFKMIWEALSSSIRIIPKIQ